MSLCPTCSGIVGWDCLDQNKCLVEHKKKLQNKNVLLHIKAEIESLIKEKHASDNSIWQYKCNNSLEHMLEIMNNCNHNDMVLVENS